MQHKPADKLQTGGSRHPTKTDKTFFFFFQSLDVTFLLFVHSALTGVNNKIKRKQNEAFMLKQ